MGLGGSPSSTNGSDTRSQTLSVVDEPLTDLQLMGCAVAVVSKLTRNRPFMVRMVEREELGCMSREAVVIADRRYRQCDMSRQNWAITKGIYLVLDMMRDEARHTVCLSAGEFRGSVTDKDGNRIEARVKIPMGSGEKDASDEDRKEPSPISYLYSTAPPPDMLIHNRHLYDRLERALDRQPNPRDATIFRLAVWYGWTQPEIGELFGITGSRVSQILARVRSRLQVEFQDLSPNRRVA